MKKAYVTVANELLAGMLKLPKSVNVSAVFPNGKVGPPNTFIVCLEGDGLPEPKDGEISQHVTIVYEKDQDDLVPNVRIKEIKKT
ncbi:hypothetical protein LCGC14_0646920 [marine sediment metagenome]|uniref:Uncharacterized protein n=1 Tax=marine sediment metagenome TaxID=412755 RepID=A0A0F9QXH6_9ZZZZ|nr:hypothetical protein [Pricia sp.]